MKTLNELLADIMATGMENDKLLLNLCTAIIDKIAVLENNQDMLLAKIKELENRK